MSHELAHQQRWRLKRAAREKRRAFKWVSTSLAGTLSCKPITTNPDSLPVVGIPLWIISDRTKQARKKDAQEEKRVARPEARLRPSTTTPEANLNVIAHPTSVRRPAGSLAASTNRRTPSTEARFAFAVLTTERKAA